MTLYVIVTPRHDDRLEERLEQEFPRDYLELESGQWLLSATGMTTQIISDQLKIGSDEDEVEGVVFATSGNWGVHTSTVWEWIASKASNG